MKLFVGQIPKSMEEDAIRPVLEEFGVVKDIKVIRDKASGLHKGCCFVTYDTPAEAEFAIANLHNIRTLGTMSKPMQVKYADSGAAPEPIPQSHKLYVGMLAKTTDEAELNNIFGPFGELEEVTVLRGANNMGKGCGFVRFKLRESALKAITTLNGTYQLEGAPGNLVVKFAESDRDKQQKRQQAQSSAILGAGGGRVMDANALAALYQVNPLLANIAANPLASAILPAVAASLGIPNTAVPATPALSPAASAYAAYPYLSDPNAAAAFSFLQTAAPAAYAVPGLTAAPAVPGIDTRTPQREGPAGCNLFIYHLPNEYTDATLIQLFSAYGTVLSSKVFIDKATMQSKCFGFVSYDKPESAAAAIAGLNGLQLGNKRLKVSLKKADTQARPAPY